jgi:hypothetical protein
MRGLRVVIAGAVLLAGTAGWFGYRHWSGTAGGPGLSAPAAAPAGRPGQLVIAAFLTGGNSYLLNPKSGEYLPVPDRVVAVSPDLRYAVLGRDRLLVLDTRTHATVRDLGRADSGGVGWSPDGRWLAIEHTGGQFEDRFIDQVRLLDLVSGHTRTVDIGKIGNCPAYKSHGWLADSTSYALFGCQSYALAGTDGEVSEVSGFPSMEGEYAHPYTRPDQAVLQADGGRLIVYDLRARRVVDEFTPPSLPSSDKPLPGIPAGIQPMGLLAADQFLVADGSRLLAWNLRTGATAPLTSRPQPSSPQPLLTATIASAGGLSDTAAHLAFRVP